MRHAPCLLSLLLFAGCTTRNPAAAGQDGAPPAADGRRLDTRIADGPLKADVSVVPGDSFIPPPVDLGPPDAVTPCGKTHVDSFTQSLNRKVDILLVIDPSGSMMDEKPRLMATAATFAQAAASNKLDFHLGSVSITPPMGSGSFTLGLLQGDPRYLTSATPNLQQEYAERIDLPMGAGQETGFDALAAAFSPALTGTVNPTSCSGCAPPNVCEAGGCRGPNWGFRRPGASLELLVFTDEDDGSKATTGATLGLLKGLVDPLAGSFVRVHALLPQSCAQSWQSFPRWLTLINGTGGKVHDLCAASYDPAIKDLTSRIFGLLDQFFLGQEPVAGTVKVQVNGQAVSFSYDPTSNSVTLASPPPDGATVSVAYTVKCGQ